jgi:acylphosphatase
MFGKRRADDQRADDQVGPSSAGPASPAGTDPEQVRLTVRVTGWVQGVGFRWTVLSVAEPLGLLGCAENLDNGDVEVTAEGSRQACQQLLNWLSGQGPRTPRVPGRVESLAPLWGPARGGFRRFSIR